MYRKDLTINIHQICEAAKSYNSTRSTYNPVRTRLDSQTTKQNKTYRNNAHAGDRTQDLLCIQQQLCGHVREMSYH
jgi:hypothetical protein